MAVPEEFSEQYIDVLRLAARWGRHPVSIGRWVKQGRLPKPRRFLGRHVWPLSEILAFERAAMAPENQPVRATAARMSEVAKARKPKVK